MSDSHSALLFAGGVLCTPEEPPANPLASLDPGLFLQNVSSLFPFLEIPSGSVAAGAFESAFNESIFQLHQSIMQDAGISSPRNHHLSPQPRPPVSSPTDMEYPQSAAAARLAAQNGGAMAMSPMPSPPRSPSFSPQSPSSEGGSSVSPSHSASSLSDDAPQRVVAEKESGITIVLDLQSVRAEICQTWGVGSSNYPAGADQTYQATRAHVESLLKPTCDPVEQYPAEVTECRLALLQGWAQALDSLSPQNKALVWNTCLLSPFFGNHIKSSFRRTLKLWADDPALHAPSIRILFGAIGYLKNQDVLKNQFLCLRSGQHIFRTFIFEELESLEPPPIPTDDKLPSPSLVGAPLQLPPPAGHSAVDFLAAAAILALYEEELDSQPKSTSKRAARDFVSAAKPSKKHVRSQHADVKLAPPALIHPSKRLIHPTGVEDNRTIRVRTN